MSRPSAVFVLLAAAACASAQVTLSTVQDGVASLTQAHDFGSVGLGSVADVEFQLTNTGATGIYLTSLGFSGPYAPDFSVVCPLSPDLCGSAPLQQLPILINPSGTVDFTVQFDPLQLGSPSTTMNITAGNIIPTVFLTGAGVPPLTVLLNNQPLGAGETIDFGNVQAGSRQTIKLMLANSPNNVPLTVPAIPTLATGAFSLAGSALSGPTVAPGSSAELDVIFAPTAMGPQQAILTIGLLTYSLQGTGGAPPPPVCPAPSILTPTTLASAQQGTLSVSLTSPSASPCPGKVTLTFQSAVSGVSDDPAITFADGTRSAVFTVAEGAPANVAFGTGTTEGTLVFTVTLGSNPAQTTKVAIPAAAIGIDAAVAVRNVACDPSAVYCTTTNIQLQINGWDNTRSTSQLVFSFFNSSGSAIAPGDITVAAGSAFQQYFASSDMAGVFGVTALFPVTGNSDDVVAALVQLTNSVGTVESAKITF